MQHLMPLLMDVLKYHISYQFKSKFEKLNKYSLAYNIFMDIGIALYHHSQSLYGKTDPTPYIFSLSPKP